MLWVDLHAIKVSWQVREGRDREGRRVVEREERRRETT